jgi:hypothetical protein
MRQLHIDDTHTRSGEMDKRILQSPFPSFFSLNHSNADSRSIMKEEDKDAGSLAPSYEPFRARELVACARDNVLALVAKE